MSNSTLMVVVGVALSGAPLQISSAQSLTCRVRGAQAWLASRPSPLDSTVVTVQGTTAKICYSRPSARGRSVDSLLAPGTAWRLGANEPTTITLTDKLDFGGAALAAGRYVMLAVPGATQWTIGFYTTPDSEPVAMFRSLKEVATGTGEVERTGSFVERFTIRADSEPPTTALLFEWGNVRVRLPVRWVP